MKKLKDKKKLIIIISCVVAVVISVLILGLTFSNKNSITLNDSDGNVFATVVLNGDNIKYKVKNEYEKEYAAYVTDEVKKILIAKGKAKETNINEYLFNNVTKINTNLDSDIQVQLKNAYYRNKALKNSMCAMAVTDLKGRVVAVYSNDSEKFLSMNKTYAGSAIKPLSVYAPAIDSGEYAWSSTFVDSPVKQVKQEDGRLRDWPANANGQYTHMRTNLSDALAYSTNTIAVKLLQDYGVKKAVALLDKVYGINIDSEKSKMEKMGEEEILSNIALGYLEEGVSVVDMAGCYQVFANDGRYVSPTTVDEIFVAEKSIYKKKYISREAMSIETATIMNKMLQRVVSVGTGKDAKLKGVTVGGKTGTSANNADNWFIGYTPEYSCAVWHSAINEGNISAKVFSSVFENVDCTVKDFIDKGNITPKIYCEKSGLLRGDNCLYCNRGYYSNKHKLSKCHECR